MRLLFEGGFSSPWLWKKMNTVKQDDWTLKKRKMYYCKYLYLNMSWRIYVLLHYVDKVPVRVLSNI